MKINKNVFKGLTLMGVLMLGTVSFAQEETEDKKIESKTTYSGNVDLYSKYGFKKGFTSFTGSEGSLELGMASVKVEHQIGKVSAVVDLGFGQRVEEFTSEVVNPTSRYIKEAYLSWEAIDNLTLTAGTFGTHIGYELLNATDNRNYSMSYAFTQGPFLNTGAKANYVMDEFNFMLGVTLPTNYRETKGVDQKTVIGQIGYTGDERSAYFNFTAGSLNPINNTDTTQFDLVFEQTITSKISAGLNATYAFLKEDAPSDAHTHWYSTVVYAKYDHNDKLNFTYRGELYGDPITYKTNIFGSTLSANYKIGELTIIPEVRGDLAQKGIFDGSKVNIYGLIAATYAF